MAFNTGNPVPSTDGRDLSDNAEALDKIVNQEVTVTTRTGKIIKSIPQIVDPVDAAATQGIIDINVDVAAVNAAADGFDAVAIDRLNDLDAAYVFTAINNGVWAAGQTFEALNQYMVFTGTAYKPKNSTSLPYIVGATPVGDNNVEVVANLSTAQGDQRYDKSQILADATADLGALVGISVRITDRADGLFDWVSGETPNTFDIVAHDTLPLQLKLRIGEVLDFKQFGGVIGGLVDNTAALQAACDIRFTIEFGGTENVFWVANPVGVPEITDIRSDKFATFKGTGAKIITDSAEAIFTSKATLLIPETEDDLFTANLNVEGVSFSGKTAALKTGVIFNGDRIYNLYITKCNFDDLDIILYSFRKKGTNIIFSEGYFQSVFFSNGNRVNDVNRIFKGSKGMNISMNGNFLEGDIELAMDIQSDLGAASVDALRIRNNVFEGGGLLGRFGSVNGAIIDGNYTESNDRFTALTHNCLILFDAEFACSGLSIKGNFFFNNDTLDASYATVKFANFRDSATDYENHWKGCQIKNNFNNSQELVEQGALCPIRDVNQNSVPANIPTYQPRPFIDAAIDAFVFENEETNVTGQGTGTQEMFKIRFSDDPKLNSNNRNFYAKVKMRVSHISDTYPSLGTGDFQVGADYFELDLLFFFRQGFGAVDTGMSLLASVTKHIPAVGDAGGLSTYLDFWGGGPVAIVTPVGDDFIIKISGYIGQTDGQAGADRIKMEGTIEAGCNFRDNISLGDMRILSI